jgi:hypothetical protein
MIQEDLGRKTVKDSTTGAVGMGYRIHLAFISVLLLSGCGCSETGIGGDTSMDDSAGDTVLDGTIDALTDGPGDAPSDWMPEPGIGSLVPEGDGTLFPTDTGEEVHGMHSFLMPVAYSGDVYMLLMRAGSSSIDEIGAFRLDPGGTSLGTTWVDAVETPYLPSICWSGEAFLAAIAVHDAGIRLVSLTGSGDLIRAPEIIAPGPYGYMSWSTGSPTHILCPAGGPLLLDFDRPEGSTDHLYHLNPDGTPDDPFEEVHDYPPTADNYDKPACTEVGSGVAYLTGESPECRVFFIAEDGTVRLSDAFGEGVSWSSGCSITAVGTDVAVVWTDRRGGDGKERLGYALVSNAGGFIVPPVTTGILVGREDTGYATASSGSHVLVVGMDGVEGLPHAFLLDLLGNQMGDAHRIDVADPGTFGASPFWEGDAYAVIWPVYMGVMYRRFRVE